MLAIQNSWRVLFACSCMTLLGAVAFNPIPSLAGHDKPPLIPTLSLPNPPMEEHVQANVLPSHGDPPVLFGGHRRRTLAANAPLDAPPPLSPPKPISKSPVMTVPAALPYGWSPSLPSPYPSCVCPPPSPIPPPPPRDCTLPPVDPLQAVFTDVLCLLQQLNQVDWAAVPTNEAAAYVYLSATANALAANLFTSLYQTGFND